MNTPVVGASAGVSHGSGLWVVTAGASAELSPIIADGTRTYDDAPLPAGNVFSNGTLRPGVNASEPGVSMSVQWFGVIVFFAAGLGCCGLANRIGATILSEVRDASPPGEAPGHFIFYFPWTGPDILARHRQLYPASKLRLYLYFCAIGLFVFLLIGVALTPDPRR